MACTTIIEALPDPNGRVEIPPDAAGSHNRALERAADDGLPVAPARLTLGQHLLTWLEQTAKPRLDPASYVSYTNIVRRHLVPSLGQIPIAQLTAQQVQAYLSAKLEAGLAPRTVATHRAILAASLKDAERWQIIPRNVAGLVRSPRIKKNKPRVFSRDEIRDFLRAVQGDRLKALYILILATGLRRNEALGLRWEDIDLEQGLLHVNVALKYLPPRRYWLDDAKTEAGQRSFALPEFIITLLRKEKMRQATEARPTDEAWQWCHLIFTRPDGHPLCPTTVDAGFQRLLARQGLAPIKLHDLRHGFSTLLSLLGIHPRVAQAILGHSNPDITLGIYTHVVPEQHRDAAERVHAFFRAYDEGSER